MEHSDYEEIRNLKARYFRYLDTRRWQDLRGLLTDDFTGDFGASDEEQFASPEAFIEGLQRNLKDATTVHHGHMPEIEVHNADQASAIWAMEDIVHTPEYELHGYGHYVDEYRRVDGKWCIDRSRLTRLKLDVRPL
jgi:hypothetical protein